MKQRERSAAQVRVEKAVFGLSLAVVVGTVGALIAADRFWEPDRALLSPHVTSTQALPDGAGTVVHFELENQGQLSVEEVTIEVASGNQRVELVIPHLPRGARREAVALLDGAPTGEPPRVRVRAYQLP